MNLNDLRNCGKCTWYDKSRSVCKVFNLQTDAERDVCFSFAAEALYCPICGKEFPRKLGVVVSNNNDYCEIVCPDCSEKMGTCFTCKNNKGCLMSENPENIPPYVIKTIRQGNMIMQRQMPNDELIDKTCKNGCACNIPEEYGSGCGRSLGGTCANYQCCLEKEENERKEKENGK